MARGAVARHRKMIGVYHRLFWRISPRVLRLRTRIHLTVIKRILPGCAIVLALSCSMAQSPSISDVPSSAVAPGKTTILTFPGKNLGGASEVWTSFPAKAVIDTNVNNSEKIVLALTLAKEVPAGIGAVQLATTNGVSNL